MFNELIESELEQLHEEHDEVVLEFLAHAYEDEYELMKEELGLTDEEYEEIHEAIVRRVSSTGQVTKMRDRATRSRRAVMTTGMSKAMLKLRARKASKTLKRAPGTVKKAVRKRRKALRRRKSLGIK